MNKNEFLHILQNELKPLGPVAVSEILADFEEHFANGLARGKTEDEITSELGNPSEIAQQYKDSVAEGPPSRPVVQFYQYQDPTGQPPPAAGPQVPPAMPQAVPPVPKAAKFNPAALIVVLVFNLLIGLAIWISLFAVLISFWVAVGSIGVAAFTLFVVAFLQAGMVSLILALFGLALTALVILLVILMAYLTKWLAKGLYHYIKWNKRLVMGGAAA